MLYSDDILVPYPWWRHISSFNLGFNYLQSRFWWACGV